MKRGQTGYLSGVVVVIAALAGAFAGFASVPLWGQDSVSADELIGRAEAAMYPRAFESRMEVETRDTRGRTTTMSFEVLHERDRGTLMEITGPGRWEGIRMLTEGETLLLYNPRAGADRPVRLTPRQSFQGSFFSNRDIAGVRFDEDYRAAQLTVEDLDHSSLGAVPTFRLEAEPRRREAAYGRIVLWLRRTDEIPLRVEYYARSGALLKSMTTLEIAELGGRSRPSVMRMEPADLEEAYSIVRILEMQAREDIDDSRFTESYLTRGEQP